MNLQEYEEFLKYFVNYKYFVYSHNYNILNRD